MTAEANRGENCSEKQMPPSPHVDIPSGQPYDPMQYQIDQLDEMVSLSLSPEKLCTPEAVTLILREHRHTAGQLCEAKSELKAESERSAELQSKTEWLRIELAKRDGNKGSGLIGIIGGALLGFGLTQTMNPQARVAGVVCTVVAVMVLGASQWGGIVAVFQTLRKQKETDSD